MTLTTAYVCVLIAALLPYLWVAVSKASGERYDNRDPRRWENADRYDITRRTSGHVGYGSGIHMCVGQLVARLEGEVMMAALARKVKSIEITGEVKRRYNNTLRGLESLPVSIEPA